MKKVSCFLILLWAATCFYLAPRIDNFSYKFTKSKGILERDVFFRTLGEAKDLISDLSYLKADEYYHGGMKHKDLQPHLCVFSEKEIQIGKYEVAHKEEHEDEYEEHKEETTEVPRCLREEIMKKEIERKKIPKFNILSRIGERLYIHQHRHLHGEEEREIIPWLYYSVKLNPHNIKAYVVGGYWIGTRLKKPDQALKFLNEGLKCNPEAWEIYSEIGNIYFYQKQDYQQAIKFFSKAVYFMTDNNSDKYDKSHAFTFLAASYDRTGNIDKAIEYYRKDVELFPTHRGFKRRLEELEEKRDKS